MSLICLSDHDLILKLAACDLLDDALESLGCARDSVYVLATAPYVVRPKAQKLGAQVAARVNEFFTHAKLIDWEPPPEEMLLFEDKLGIDSGEAILFASTAILTDFVLATGDKRCVLAMAGDPELAAIVRRVSGRVVCFEQIIQRCIRLRGFEVVSSKVMPARDCDKSLFAIFGTGLVATADSVEQGLNSYISDLRVKSGALLMV